MLILSTWTLSQELQTHFLNSRSDNLCFCWNRKKTPLTQRAVDVCETISTASRVHMRSTCWGESGPRAAGDAVCVKKASRLAFASRAAAYICLDLSIVRPGCPACPQCRCWRGAMRGTPRLRRVQLLRGPCKRKRLSQDHFYDQTLPALRQKRFRTASVAQMTDKMDCATFQALARVRVASASCSATKAAAARIQGCERSSVPPAL